MFREIVLGLFLSTCDTNIDLGRNWRHNRISHSFTLLFIKNFVETHIWRKGEIYISLCIIPSPPTQLRRGVHRMSSISRKKGGIFVPERDSCFWEIGGYFVVEARKRGIFSGPEFVILYRKEGAPDVDDSNLQNHWSVKTFHWYFTWIIKNDYDKTQLNITCNNF